MVIYTCELCNKEFYKKSHLLDHLNRKYKCNEFDQNIRIEPNIALKPVQMAENSTKQSANSGSETGTKMCTYCNKTFTRIASLRRHVNETCKKKKEQDMILELNKKIDKLENIVTQTMDQNKQLIEKLNEQTQIKSIDNSQMNCTNTNCNNTNNIVMVNFGLENHHKLTESEMLKIANSGYRAIENCVKTIHLNDKYPEFKNVCIPNLRSDVGYIHDGEWKAEDMNYILDQVLDARSYDIQSILDKYKQNLERRDLERVQDQITRINNKEEQYIKQMKREIKLLLYNSRDKVAMKKSLQK